MRLWTFKEKHGRRFVLYCGRRGQVSLTFYWWTHFCHVNIESTNEGWKWSVALPPLALFFGVDGFGLWRPTYQTVATWDNNRPLTLPDRREFSLSIHDWTLRLTPWGRWGEWRARDPWWIRGISLNLPDVALGRSKYSERVIAESIPCSVPMPEGTYAATAKVTQQEWKRPLWFRRSTVSAWLDIPKGIPHAGKGENSWDCGDDGLFGIGGNSVEHAIQRAQETVISSRQKYGHASNQSVQEALS